MAPLPVIPDIYRVAWNWEAANGSKATNVMHFASGELDPLDWVDTFATAVESVSSNLLGGVSEAWSVRSFDVTPLDGISATVTVPTDGTALWDGIAGPEYFPQAATLIKLTTGVRGRSGRGRVFLPGAAESVYDQGTLNESVRSDVTLAWLDLQAELTVAGLAIHVASYKNESASIASGLLCESKVATQRRRNKR